MTNVEWTVVTVLIAIVGLIGTVATPMVKLTSCINKLSGQVETLLKNLDEFKERYQKNLDEQNNKHERLAERIRGLEQSVASLAQKVEDMNKE